MHHNSHTYSSYPFPDCVLILSLLYTWEHEPQPGSCLVPPSKKTSSTGKQLWQLLVQDCLTVFKCCSRTFLPQEPGEGTAHHEAVMTQVSHSGKGAVVSTNGKSLSTEGFTILCDECLVFPLKGQGWLKWHLRLTGTPSPVPPTILLLFLFLNNFTKTLHVRGSSTIKKNWFSPKEWLNGQS